MVLKPFANSVASEHESTSKQRLLTWAVLSIATNIILLLTILLLLFRDQTELNQLKAPPQNTSTSQKQSPPEPQLGPRHQWSYQQWVAQLEREADAIAKNKPENLMILAGDSISLWFPPQLLPPDITWLNQGISGETSDGLLKRLPLLDETQPKTIFMMIGINDLIRGVSDETILSNQRLIIQDLKWVHPNTQIVVQSILPHAGEQASWEGRDRLLEIPNRRIRELNKQLAQIATEEGVKYLDLYPLFADNQGNLRTELTSDGLHLSQLGYLVWRSGLQVFMQVELNTTTSLSE